LELLQTIASTQSASKHDISYLSFTRLQPHKHPR
jgi:hypothetical protein